MLSIHPHARRILSTVNPAVLALQCKEHGFQNLYEALPREKAFRDIYITLSRGNAVRTWCQDAENVPCLPRRHSVIGSEAAQQRAELGKQYYQHSQCGRKRMGNSVYIGTTSLLKKAYINCNCIYEVRCILVVQAVLRTSIQGS